MDIMLLANNNESKLFIANIFIILKSIDLLKLIPHAFARKHRNTCLKTSHAMLKFFLFKTNAKMFGFYFL